jgi:hypothetical protein
MPVSTNGYFFMVSWFEKKTSPHKDCLQYRENGLRYSEHIHVALKVKVFCVFIKHDAAKTWLVQTLKFRVFLTSALYGEGSFHKQGLCPKKRISRTHPLNGPQNRTFLRFILLLLCVHMKNRRSRKSCVPSRNTLVS